MPRPPFADLPLMSRLLHVAFIVVAGFAIAGYAVWSTSNHPGAVLLSIALAIAQARRALNWLFDRLETGGL